MPQLQPGVLPTGPLGERTRAGSPLSVPGAAGPDRGPAAGAPAPGPRRRAPGGRPGRRPAGCPVPPWLWRPPAQMADDVMLDPGLLEGSLQGSRCPVPAHPFRGSAWGHATTEPPSPKGSPTPQRDVARLLQELPTAPGARYVGETPACASGPADSPAKGAGSPPRHLFSPPSWPSAACWDASVSFPVTRGARTGAMGGATAPSLDLRGHGQIVLSSGPGLQAISASFCPRLPR